MEPIKIMINGLPGNVASAIAVHAAKDPRVILLPHSLTGPEIETDQVPIDTMMVELIRPDRCEARLDAIAKAVGDFISVDFTHPSAVNANADLYCRRHLPFVMGTTGGDREKLVQRVTDSDICAVIAPNMAKQIVGFQAMLEYGATTFPDIFKGYALSVRESHQAGKADTSGTAKAVVSSFNRMGVEFSTKAIEKERDPKTQQQDWGIPEAYLSGHGWHTYRLTSPDGTVTFEFQHNINGRDVYAGGTIDAICFLAGKLKSGCRAKVFSMIDVLKG
ncbi:4-hydroxy-tetrahydrodipicolinate reductase [Desulfosarcina ovata subsp. sediminis]|uniref:4-hydroxy-tetrahydrodipicolinate reductase n=1 Tax=Desulfosarcina ovata subsp. sediminis TaxID=885957 RepID=A0A5K7ZC44_9BACT|nr:dihydrodipicolinate reductase [Desulfosarcina ovata]BBO79542.1 4-hydroxy-tetrahydrodipicolinate reductase [Desulfosarcina ovata subsp. sediminis]